MAALCGCSKPGGTEHEAFTFQGYLYDCHSGQPIEGATVSVVAKHLENGGFFNTSHDAGATTTDAHGHYSIAPEKFAGTTDFELSFTKGDTYAGGNGISADSINRAHLTAYTFTEYLSQPGWLKIILNDVNAPDSTDTLSVQVNVISSCNGYAEGYYSSNPPFAGNMPDFYKGAIHNGYTLYRISAQDSVLLHYNVMRHGHYGTLRDTTIFCPTTDTTYFRLDY